MSERSELREISIKGLGVIDEARLEVGQGFTVLTGETGAGKTMVLTALALVLGGKADANLLRKGRDRLVASATFKVSKAIAESAIQRGADVEDSELILTRTLNAEGKSRASAGGVAVPAGVLADLGETLIEIHGQSASMSITKVARQREILDRYAGKPLSDALAKYTVALEEYTAHKLKIAALKKSAASREKEIAALQEFDSAFKKINPRSGEASALLGEIGRLSSVESIRLAIEETVAALSEDEIGALRSLASVKKALASVADKDPVIAEMLAAVSDSYFQLSDASLSAVRYLEDLEADPVRLDAAQNRRAELTTFLRRFASDGEPDQQIDELLVRHKLVAESIADLTGGEDRLLQMEEELSQKFAAVVSQAKSLSALRSEAAARLSAAVSKEIRQLSMPHTQFHCTVVSADYSNSLAASDFTSHGADEISMLLQAHKDGPLVQVAKGASGGELSRVLLALEVVLAQSEPVGTYIFDEVDAGVGGKAAVEVGRRLHELSRHAQVIVVTHLPQVAAWADSHFLVRKSDSGSVSQSDVVKVEGESRVEEIARMLAGHEDSRSAREHAAELLDLQG